MQQQNNQNMMKVPRFYKVTTENSFEFKLFQYKGYFFWSLNVGTYLYWWFFDAME